MTTIIDYRPTQPNIILIVDDNPTNLDVLFTYLTSAGYKVLVAENGAVALRRARYTKPDLILLDVMMPDVNGFEVCRALKEDSATREIPIIFMTALTDVADKVRGFEVGAVDYITKPLQYKEVLARVSTHLTLRNLQRELETANQELAARNKELDAYAYTLAHNLQSPLASLILYTDLLQAKTDPTAPQTHYLTTIAKTVKGVSRLVEDLLFFARVKESEVVLTVCDMGNIVASSQERLRVMIEEYQAQMILPSQWPPVLGHPSWIEEVWMNYLSNAIKYGGTPPVIELGSSCQPDGQVRFWVHDNGAGLSYAEQAQLFAEFTRLAPEKRPGHGLGLSIVKRIVSRLNGEVGVESTSGQGSTFYFTLPHVSLPH
ncbi:MAG: response regulator [Caldilineaceae bacterium]